MKVLVVSSRDLTNPNVLSGTSYFILKNLREIADVSVFDKLMPNQKIFKFRYVGFYWRYLLCKFVEVFYKAIGKEFRWERTLLISKYYASQIEEYLVGKFYDGIVVDKASVEIAFLKTSIPIYYMSDATVNVMLDFYPEFSRMPKFHINNVDLIEQQAIDNAEKCIYRSNWAANSAVNDYGKDKKDVAVIPVGPGFSTFFSIEEVEKIIELRANSEKCNLLLVGVDWYRKGCDLAVDVVDRLVEMGVNAHLTICGLNVPAGIEEKLKNVTVIKRIDKSDEEQFFSLYRDASFFVFPSRADCLGISVIEAMSSACPIVISGTGGMSDLKEENGFLYQPFDVEQAALDIKKTWEDKQDYRCLCLNSYKKYLKDFSWRNWKIKMEEIFKGNYE